MLSAEQLASAAHPPKKLPWYRILYVQVLIAIALGIALGYF